MSENQVEDIDVLVAARAAWEALRDEMDSHTQDRDVYLCLACWRRAKAFTAAVDVLSEMLNRGEG